MNQKSRSYNIGQTNSEYGRLPPQAVEVEEAVIGAMMLEADAYSNVSQIVNSGSFYKEEHQIIFNRIKELSDTGVPIDLMQVVQSLKNNNELDKLGGPLAITELTDKVASAGNIEHWAKIIQQKFIQREIIRIASEMGTTAYDDTADISEILESASSKLTGLFAAPTTNVKTMSVLVDEMHERIKKNYLSKNNITGFATGIPSLDKHTGGLQKTDLTIMAAEASQGKTSLAITITNNTTALDNPVGFLSIEMPGVQLATKITSQETGITSGSIWKSKLLDKDIGLIESMSKDIKSKLIYVDDTVQSLDSVLSSIRYIHHKYAAELFFVDFIQLITIEKLSDEARLAKVARSLKNIAKELDISIVAISQLSRDTGSKSNHKPTMNRLRGSGQIEEAADNIIFIWRPEYYDIEYFDEADYVSTEGKALIDFAKGRNIGIDDFVVSFKKEVGLFYEELQFPSIVADPNEFIESSNQYKDSDSPF